MALYPGLEPVLLGGAGRCNYLFGEVIDYGKLVQTRPGQGDIYGAGPAAKEAQACLAGIQRRNGLSSTEHRENKEATKS